MGKSEFCSKKLGQRLKFATGKSLIIYIEHMHPASVS